MNGYTAAKRSVFIVGTGGLIKYKWVTENPGVQPDFDEIQNELSKLP